MTYLVDTDVCSAYIRGNRVVWPKFLQYFGRVHVSTVTAAELWVWALKPRAPITRERGVETLLPNVAVLPVDETVARRFGDIRADQLRHGNSTPALDV